jgi:hypothetical protein
VCNNYAAYLFLAHIGSILTKYGFQAGCYPPSAQPESLSPNTAQNILNKNAKIPPDIVDKFYALASDWEKDLAGLSSTAQMSQHPAYQEIISMGTQIVPLLLSELKRNPLYWLSALSAITGENPIKPEQRGRVKQMASAWIDWGRNQGYAIEENV